MLHLVKRLEHLNNDSWTVTFDDGHRTDRPRVSY